MFGEWFVGSKVPERHSIWKERGSEGRLSQSEFQVNSANGKEVEYALRSVGLFYDWVYSDGRKSPFIPQPPHTIPRRAFLNEFYQVESA